MADRFTINLAFPSPLYAPLYLAKQTQGLGIFKHIDFEYAERGRAHQPRMDRLTHNLLSRHGGRNCLLSVGDPLRFLDLSAEGYDRPVLAGGLLQRMCYWVVDGDADWSGDKPFTEVFLHLVAHPKHMTGYKLARYELNQVQGVQDKDVLDRFIYHETEPGYEKRWFDKLSRRLKSAKQDKHLAYLTADPVEATREVDRMRVKRVFLMDDRYANCMMTGLITGEEIAVRRKGQIEDALGGIERAIEGIYQDPEGAADWLLKYSDSAIDFRARYSRAELKRVLELLSSFQAYYPRVSRGDLEEEMLRRHLARAYQIHMCSASEEALTPKLECLCGLSAAQEKEGLPSVPRFYWNRSLYFSGSATKAVRGGFGWILRVMSAFFVTLSSLGLVQSLNPAGESEFSVISSQSSAKLSALPGLAALGFSAIGLLLVLPDLKELRTDSDSDEHLGLLAAVILASLSLFVLLRAVISFEGAFTTALPIGGAMMGAYLLHLDRWNVLRQARRKFVGLRESFRLWNRVRKAQLLA